MVVSDVLADAECEQLLLVRDRASRATFLVALHDTRQGPAHGGIRRSPYPDLEAAARDVVQLARAMTWKCALAEVPAGGGKCVLLDHPGLDRVQAYRAIGRTVAQLGGRFYTGPDVGTTDADLREVATETKCVAVPAAASAEGPGDLAEATATGVHAALRALAERLGRSIDGMQVLIQGLGATGARLAKHLAQDGARLLVSDVRADAVAAVVAATGAQAIAPERVLTTPCDVFAPCALGGVLTIPAARTLPALGVCGSANNVFAEPAAAHELHRRGVLAVPDFVANAGALIQGATWHLTGVRVDEARLQRIGATTGELLDRARAQRVPPIELALELAQERLHRRGA
ncbi:MAG: Glu/Leu/Phe/Val dehydrogenase [Planctomycetes bacterium]|nr:Glu/Leu/Phe/Val dehydrogenase [Planctomycetota bacterium]